MKGNIVNRREFYYVQFLRKPGELISRDRGKHSLPGWRDLTDHKGRRIDFLLLPDAERQSSGLAQREDIQRARVVTVSEEHSIAPLA